MYSVIMMHNFMYYMNEAKWNFNKLNLEINIFINLYILHFFTKNNLMHIFISVKLIVSSSNILYIKIKFYVRIAHLVLRDDYKMVESRMIINS